MSRKILSLGATPENAINEEAEAQDATPKRTRTYMHTARIVKQTMLNGATFFCAMNDGKITAQFAFNPENAELLRIPDVMGHYDGFQKYYRTNQDKFQTVLITKSEDSEVPAAQVDPYTVESFLRSYLDRLETKRQLEAMKDAPEDESIVTSL